VKGEEIGRIFLLVVEVVVLLDKSVFMWLFFGFWAGFFFL